MNFSLVLFLLTVVTGLFWLAERFRFLPERRRRTQDALAVFNRDNKAGLERGEFSLRQAQETLKNRLMKQPIWLEYTAGLFPVIAVVFIIRSFVIEPFRIPSGSMLPTLHVGDFIVVNKYEYGVRLPVINTKILEVGEPKRGDVIVFRYPMDTNIDYIKRVVGVPGDTVEYRNKVLYLNGVEQSLSNMTDFIDEETLVTLNQFDEQLGNVDHMIALDSRRPGQIFKPAIKHFESTCEFTRTGFICKVPEKHYWAMGDNRDNSEDSRYWGYVPEENLVGRAFFIWANFGDFSRIGSLK